MTERCALTARGLRCDARGPSGERVEILRGIDLSAAPGELIGLCGPNGAGKSTLLRALAGLMPARGEILLRGEPIRRTRPRTLARRLAFLHQDAPVEFAFTAREVVAMGRYPHRGVLGAPGASDAAAVERALALACCADYADRPVTHLSGGERRRVMLARALAQETPVLLLDEPATGLDLRYTREIFALAARLAAEGRLVFAVAHDLRVAAAYCTRAVLLAQGRLLADAPPRQAFTESNLRAAFDIPARVFNNPAGEWDFYIEDGEATPISS